MLFAKKPVTPAETRSPIDRYAAYRAYDTQHPMEMMAKAREAFGIRFLCDVGTGRILAVPERLRRAEATATLFARRAHCSAESRRHTVRRRGNRSNLHSSPAEGGAE